MTTASFGAHHIELRRYPFGPASVRKNARVPFADVRSAAPTAAPPEIILHSGETLFIDARQRPELEAAIARGRIALETRPDVWGLILEPFVDTEHSPEDRARTLEILAQIGLPPARVDALRSRVGPAVLCYNAILWDWVHLGLYDLLQAHAAWQLLPWRRRAFQDLYWLGMELADLGRSSGPGRE